MARVTFSRVNSMTVDVAGEWQWVAAYTGNAGSAKVRVPRSSPAASPDYIAPEGGSVVRRHDDGAGPWGGFVESVEETSDALVLTVLEPQHWFGRRAVAATGTHRNLPAGAIAALALGSSLGGMRGLRPAAEWHEGGPLIPEYTFRGQTLADVLSDMMAASGSEVYIGDDGAVAWCGPFAHATRHDTLLVAGGNLSNARYRTSSGGRVSEVTAISGDDRYTARSGTAARDWPGQATVTVDGGLLSLVAAAQAELDQRSRPTVIVEGNVGKELWHIRERDYVRAHLSWAGIGAGRGHVLRVLERRLSDDGGRMQMVFMVIPEIAGTPLTAGAGGRVRPPARASRDGRAGSPLAQIRAVQRMTAELRQMETTSG